jgi:hypothetical protein
MENLSKSLRRGRQVCGLTLLLAFLCPATASAQSGDAMVAFEEGRKLMEEGRYTEACPKLALSLKLLPSGLGTAINLGQCYEKQGKTASAWVVLKEAVSQAVAQGRADRKEQAASMAAALENRVSRLSLHVSPAVDVPGLTIKLDGREIQRPMWDTFLPVDPGPHDIEVSAPGKEERKEQITVSGEGVRLSHSIGPLVRKTSEPPPPPPSSTAPQPSPPPRPAETHSPLKPVGFVLGGLGAAGLLGGALFWWRSSSKHQEALDHCPDNHCDSTANSLQDDSKSAATLATASVIAGGALLSTGILLVVLSPSGGDTTAAISPGAGKGWFGLTARGRF